MSNEYRKISVNVDPAPGVITTNFLDEIKSFVTNFTAENDYTNLFDEDNITLEWYYDAPVSEGVSIGVKFNIIEGVDYTRDLVISLRKNKYVIRGIAVGY